MTTSREEAIAWVHKFAIGGAVLAALPLPFTAAGQVLLQNKLMSTIGEVYGLKSETTPTSVAVRVGLALAARGLKYAGTRAEEAAPKAAKPLIRAAVAGATIEAIGLALVLLHEREGGVREIA